MVGLVGEARARGGHLGVKTGIPEHVHGGIVLAMSGGLYGPCVRWRRDLHLEP